MNGINTIIQDTIPKPSLHKVFNKNVTINIIINLKNAVLNKPLNKSIIIWVEQKNKYINAGGHKSNIFVSYNILIKKRFSIL